METSAAMSAERSPDVRFLRRRALTIDPLRRLTSGTHRRRKSLRHHFFVAVDYFQYESADIAKFKF
jgi:hypothetical protein